MNGPPRRPLKFRGRWHFKSMSWEDLVRLVASRHGHPGLSDDEVAFVLWELTAFPLCSPNRVCVQLHRYFTAQEGGT
jgi:hypothetical protein